MMKYVSYLLWFLIIPLLILLYATKEYRIISAAIVVLAILPFFLSFELSRPQAVRIVLVAVLSALNVVLRIIFSPLPFFKPLSALVILIGLAFGSESGFLVGAFSALLSNFYFGQGIWTPYQMFAWGFIGALSGLLKPVLELKRLPRYLILALAGILSAFLFSGIMDVQTAIYLDNRLLLSRFLAAATASLPFTLTHAAANVFFLLVFGGFVLRTFKRIEGKFLE